MMYKAFNLKGFDNSFILPEYREFLTEKGRKVTAAGKQDVRQTLEEIAKSEAALDGQAIQDAWFPQVEADVFLSHSHRDEGEILMLAGWLDHAFGLKAFVDSSIWGYAGTLLKLIDNEYCYQEASHTYSYERRNDSTSHVHMMLMTALQMMIHKTECLIFVNTPASIAAQDVVTAQTFSPWIYAELTTAGIVDIVTPKRIATNEALLLNRAHLKAAADKSLLNIIHSVRNMSRLKRIDCDLLRTWVKEVSVKGPSALDTLYEVAAR